MDCKNSHYRYASLSLQIIVWTNPLITTFNYIFLVLIALVDTNDENRLPNTPYIIFFGEKDKLWDSFFRFCIPILIWVYFHFRLFGHGNGTILAIILFFCLFILENRLNYDDEIMVMQKLWYPLLYMVPGFIGNVFAKFLQHFDCLPLLDIPYSLLAMYAFIVVGIVIPSSMINRSKKCKEFVLKKILTPFFVCRNWQWIEINKDYL